MIRFFPIVFLFILFSCNSKTEIRVTEEDTYGDNKETALKLIEYTSAKIGENQIMLLISPVFEYKQKGNVVKLKKYRGFDWWSTDERTWRQLVVDKNAKIEYEDVVFHIENNKYKYLSTSLIFDNIFLLLYEKVPWSILEE